MAALYGLVSGLASFVVAVTAVRAAVPWWCRARLDRDRLRAVLSRQRGGHVVSPLVGPGSGAVLATGDAIETPWGTPLAVWRTSAVALLCHSRKTSAPSFPPAENLGAQGATKSVVGGKADVPAAWS